MNDRCTPATARRLKEQGFPQPVPAPGQVWYDRDDTAVLMIEYHARTRLVIGSNGVMYGGKAADIITYAPTAPDVLRELGANYSLTVDWIGGVCTGNEIEEIRDQKGFVLQRTTKPIQASHDNTAEACAMAWEAKQKS